MMLLVALVDATIALGATFLGVLGAFCVEEIVRARARREEDARRASEEAAELKRIRQDLLRSVERNQPLLSASGIAAGRGSYLPVASLEFATWEAHQERFLVLEHDGALRAEVARFYERMATLQRLVALARLETERIERVRPAGAGITNLDEIRGAAFTTHQDCLGLGAQIAKKLA